MAGGAERHEDRLLRDQQGARPHEGGSTFKWQHGCILFLRAFLAYYPEREEELAGRIEEGRFDIGGTFTEPFEETLYDELLVRQMYSGRKWFVERYPTLDSAVVAFYQDGPLRALQMPQIYAKAGIRYLKASRLSDNIFRWTSPDGSSLLAFQEVHYGEEKPDGGGYGGGFTPDVALARMEYWRPQFESQCLPPVWPATVGIDYHDPWLAGDFVADWNAASDKNGWNVSVAYSTFKEYLSTIEKEGRALRTVVGERPNLWWPEASPTHHRMFDNLRAAARLLPAAEMFATFRALVDGSFASYPEEVFGAAWLNVTIQDHGLGHQATPYDMDDRLPWLVNKNSPPYADYLYQEKWACTHRTAEALVSEAQLWLAARMVRGAPGGGAATAAGDAAAVVIFNSLAWARADPVELAPPQLKAMGLHLASRAAAYEVHDAAGATVASQLSVTGSLVFVASVPSLGWARYVSRRRQRRRRWRGRRPRGLPPARGGPPRSVAPITRSPPAAAG